VIWTWKPPNDGHQDHHGTRGGDSNGRHQHRRREVCGLLRLTWNADHLAHVLEHSHTDEPTGTWTGLACPDHGLALGTDVDTATLQRLCAEGDVADLIWEALQTSPPNTASCS